MGEGPKWSASNKPSFESKGNQPGPGDYSHVDMATSERNPKWGFGTSRRPDSTGSVHLSTPGPGAYPGAYMNGTSLGAGPKYSMKSRLAAPRTHPSPGPGAHGGHYTSFG